MKRQLILKFLIVVVLFNFLLFWSFQPDNKNNTQNKKQNEQIENQESIIKEQKIRKISIAMVGDALIHSSVYNDAHLSDNIYDFSPMFEDFKHLLNGYDLKYYNQETIIGGKDLGLSNYPTFNSPDEIGLDLVSIGFNMVSLANNHTLDKGEKGILYSIDFWNSQDGVITSGSYSSLEDKDNIKIYETNDIRYAFLSYTTGTNGLYAPSGKEYLVNVYSEELVKNDIAKIKDEVDLILVAMHWGSEYTFTPTNSQKDIAEYLSNLGVDLIIGTHPHVIQPIDKINNTLVIYSLGNFISGQKPLGLDKIVGLFVGVDIIVNEDDSIIFDNLNYELLYTYSTSNNKNFKVIPFSKLNEEILPNYQSINDEYSKIVETEVKYD